MAIQSRTTKLKLHDDDPKSLGASHIQSGTLSCMEGLVEGQDFAVDYGRGTVRRLKPFDRELWTFAFDYDDRAELFAALDDERKQREADLNALLAQYRGKSAVEPITGKILGT